MATNPEAWQEQGPVNSIEKQVNESWAQGEVGAVIGLHSSPPQEKRAPRAEPEEDIDDLEPVAQGQTLSRIQKEDATELDNRESTATRETVEAMTEELPQNQSEAPQPEEESTNPADISEDDFPAPPSPLITSSTDECLEAEGFSVLAEDPVEDLMLPDKEGAQTTELTELVYQEVQPIPEEMTAGDMAAEEMRSSSKASDNNEAENYLSGSSHPSSSDSNNSDDLCSPPFADESEAEEEGSMNDASCQEERGRLDSRSKPLQGSCSSANDPSLLPAVPSDKQQGELSPQSQCALVPKRANQEAAQQVQGQSSPPLSTVAMEPSNQGEAASQVYRCTEAVRERESRAGKSAVGDSEQTGEEEGQKESGPNRNRAKGQPGSSLLRLGQRQERYMTERYCPGVIFKHRKHNRMKSESCEDSHSDSGLSADFSPCSTLEGSSTVSTGTPASIETPIEREIRRSIEREHSLRRSRGLPNLSPSPEYVEVPSRKSVLSQSLTKRSEMCQGKDRQFAGKKMQQEIYEETQRERDLVELGKIPGIYDKGTVRQLKDKKQLFEVFQQPSESTSTLSTRSKTTSCSSDVSTLEENQEDTLSQTSTIEDLHVERRQSLDSFTPPVSPYSAKGRHSTYSTSPGMSFSKDMGHQFIIDSNQSFPAQKPYHAKLEAEPVTTVDSGAPNIYSGIFNEEEEVAPKDNPFFKLRRSSTKVPKVEQDILETQEREKELRKQRMSLYGGTWSLKGGGVEKPEEKTPTMSDQAVPDTPDSSSRWRKGPSAAEQSAGKASIWPPAQAEEERTTQREVLSSPQTPRQKNPLVQRWESGLVNGHNEGDD